MRIFIAVMNKFSWLAENPVLIKLQIYIQYFVMNKSNDLFINHIVYL